MTEREPFWTLWRAMAVELAVAQIVLIWYLAGGRAGWYSIAGSVIPLACIWFPREMGRYCGIGLFWPIAITEKTPGPFVAIAGWLVLPLPTIILAGVWLYTRGP